MDYIKAGHPIKKYCNSRIQLIICAQPSGIYKASDVTGVGWAHIINCAHQYVDGYGSQIMLGYGTTGSMWFRSSSGGTFSAWHRLWHDADFYFQTS